MLNKNQIITMTKMATYSQGYKKRCMKVCSFYKKDYVVYQTIMSLLLVTLGYILAVGAGILFQLDELTYILSIDLIIDMGIMIVGVYAILLIVFGVVSAFYYNYKYKLSLKEARKYYQALERLNAMYKREKK